MSTPDILKRILGVKREEVAAAQAIKPLSAVRAEAEAARVLWIFSIFKNPFSMTP